MSGMPVSPGRPPADPSGRKVALKIGLSPRHRAILDKLATEKGKSRSEVVAALLERTVKRDAIAAVHAARQG